VVFSVLVTGEIDRKGLKLLESEPGFSVDFKPGLTRKQLLQIIGKYDAIICRSETGFDAELASAAKKLRVFARAGVGLDNVDVGAASKHGIAVMNAPAGNTIAAAEHTFALLLSACRLLPNANNSLKQGKWERKRFMGPELYKKTLGIIGFGRIGSRVAIRAKSFGMNVITFDPYIMREKPNDLGVELIDDLDMLLKRSDFITVHTSLNEETRGMISEREFGLMKDGVIVVNCARGGIYNEKALSKALASGKVRAAAADVFSSEPPKSIEFISLDNAVVTPHIGANTFEAQQNLSEIIVKQTVKALRFGEFENTVNVPFIGGERFKEIKSYLLLGEKLGSLLAQLCQGRIDSIEVEVKGSISSIDAIKAFAVKGVMQKILDGTVNEVNALHLANERGIRVSSLKSEQPRDFSNMVEVRLKAGKETRKACGVVFGNRFLRIVKVDDIFLELIPEGSILFLSNHDKPGVIGCIGTMLGDNGVNIATWQLGRDRKGGTALAAISLDNPIGADLLKSMLSLENIIDVKQVIL